MIRAVRAARAKLVALGLSAVLLAGHASAQDPRPQSLPRQYGTVVGTVRDDAGRGVAGARIGVVGALGKAESDEAGAFRLTHVPVGDVRVAVQRMGFGPETLTVRVRAPEETPVRVALARVSTPLAAVIVRGRQELRGPIAGFYDRLERGHGHFFTEQQIDKASARRLSDLLRAVPGVRVEQRRTGARTIRMRGSIAAPQVWLDGVPMAVSEIDLDNFDPRTFAGIEVYSGSATVPLQFSGGPTASSSGGAILLWTREGTPRVRARGKDEPSAATVLAQLRDRDQVFTRDEVETPARPIGEPLLAPVYPDVLYNARQGGRIEVEFVVDIDGTPRMDTFGVVASTHPSLAEAVRRSIEVRQFVPATRRGVPVAQLVQQPFTFLPDTMPGMRKPEN